MESFENQLARLHLMASGNEQWDLSENDCAAIRAVLDELRRLRAIVAALLRGDGG